MPFIEYSQVVALLGRALSKTEKENFDIYRDIAERRLADLMCRKSLGELITEDGQKLPSDLLLVLARLIGAIQAQNSVEFGVESKQVEDFRITYKDKQDIIGDVIATNGATIMKYSACGMRAGKSLMQDPRYWHNDRV